LSAPALREAVAGLAAAPGPMVAVPLMLAAAGHAKGDIPAALARERTRHPAVSFTYARPLGPHPALLELLADRIAAVSGPGDPAAAYAAAHPELDIRCADVLGDCDEIAALVYERYHEALAGDIRMNCDVCVYRIAMPGFEHRVGEPQHPHDHPHDHVHDVLQPHPQARLHG